MKSLILKITIFLFAFSLVVVISTTEVSAQADTCKILQGKLVKTYDKHRTDVLDWTFIGAVCDIPGDFNENKTCAQPTGGRYHGYYCNPIFDEFGNRLAKGCEAESPPYVGDNPPVYCNRPDPGVQTDISKVFGQIMPPPAIHSFGFGAAGISKFLSNLITLIYSLAAVVLIFMLLWGAFDWLTSGGEKEKVEAARNRITYALIGMILFAVAFAVIQLLGTFTGFTFFAGQK